MKFLFFKKKKSPNIYTTWNKGKICDNCNKIGWRLAEKFSDDDIVIYYCIYCGMMFAKKNDFSLKKLKQYVRKESKLKNK